MAKAYPSVYVVRYNTPDGIPTITKYWFYGRAKKGIKVMVKDIVKYIPTANKEFFFSEDDAKAAAVTWCGEVLSKVRKLMDKLAKACAPDHYIITNT